MIHYIIKYILTSFKLLINVKPSPAAKIREDSLFILHNDRHSSLNDTVYQVAY